jgi:hypothetical protein
MLSVGAPQTVDASVPSVVPPIITVEGVIKEDEAGPAQPRPSVTPLALVEPVENEIVVTGENYGKARVEAETEFSEDRIAAHGADSIQELIKKLAPWISPDGEEPILLINGEPAGFDRSILSYPPEALRRLEVLKPEAATEYGQEAGKRVVNLVLKRKFASFNADIGGNWATAGGQSGKQLSFNRSAISGRMRWNASVRMSDDSKLMKYRRHAQRMDGIFDGSGVIIPVGAGELDPALSLLAGRPIFYAAMPEGPISDLSALLHLANLRDEIDPARYDSFSPDRRNLSMTIGVTRPLGGMSLSVSINANLSDTEAFRGPAMAQMVWRQDHSASPFSQDVEIVRPVDSLHGLRSASNNKSVGASVNLNGSIAGWQSNFGLNYNRSWSESLLENGVDRQTIQDALDARYISPFDALGAEWIDVSRNKGRNDNLSARANVQRSILTLPAGGLSLSIGANASLGSNKSMRRTQRDNFDQMMTSRRQQAGGQFSLNIPINREKIGLLPLPINLSLDVSSSASQSSGGRLQRSSSFGGNLEPWPWLQLRGSFDVSQMAPAFEQLDGVLDERIQRVFDYRRQEMVDVIWVTGGNPDLRRGRREGLSLNAMVRPFRHGGIMLNVGYRRSDAMNGISALPELSPSVEQAFPDRIQRDAEGRLLRVDARSINLESDSQSSLSNSLNLRWPMEMDAQRSDQAWDFQASITHQASLTATRRIRDGLPTINLLAGETGQSRHNLSGQITASRRGLGVTFSGQWSSGGRLAGGEQGALLFKPPVMVNLSTFLEPHRFWPQLKDDKIWKGMRLSLDVQNVTRAYRRVLREDGTVPPGYGRDDVDPLGRTIKIQLRKGF